MQFWCLTFIFFLYCPEKMLLVLFTSIVLMDQQREAVDFFITQIKYQVKGLYTRQYIRGDLSIRQRNAALLFICFHGNFISHRFWYGIPSDGLWDPCSLAQANCVSKLYLRQRVHPLILVYSQICPATIYAICEAIPLILE